MKTSIQHENRQGKYNKPVQENLSVKDAITWFLITVIALCIASTSHARTVNSIKTLSPAPVANNIMMTPLVQLASILPLSASSQTSVIGSYTVLSIPQPDQGILYIEMNGELMAVSEGMMLTADMGSKLVFEPDALFNGEVVFTYNAADEDGYLSNIATYTIPVVAKQNAILPIRLLNFNGAADNKKVQLYWLTENEGNSSYFEIQRSINGVDFEPIAVTTAKGNTATSNNYHTTDDLFFYQLKSVYYRLKMVNVNGSFTYSNSVLITFNNPVKNSVTVWPMPFNNNLNISFSSEENTTVKIMIYSVGGSAVMALNQNVKKGTNIISLYQAQTIPAGTYLLTISNSAKAETIKVIKQ